MPARIISSPIKTRTVKKAPRGAELFFMTGKVWRSSSLIPRKLEKDQGFSDVSSESEQFPLFVLHNRESRNLGTRSTFADTAVSVAEFFSLPQRWPVGTSRITGKAALDF